MNSSFGHWIVSIVLILNYTHKEKAEWFSWKGSERWLSCRSIIRRCLRQTVVFFSTLAALANPSGKGLVSS